MSKISSKARAVVMAQEWLAQDPDPETRAELEMLLRDSLQEEALIERFAGSLQFGTAGLRGIMGAGPMRMNRVLVKKVSTGLGHYVSKSIDGAYKKGVVIGYDGRHKSRVFAEDTARILLGQGFQVYLSTDVVPTPVVAYAVNHYGAAAGVMVTASHNPPAYNGYKVYWDNGAQIIPPQDKGIAAAIEKVGNTTDVVLVDLDEALKTGQLVDLDAAVIDVYLDGIARMSVNKGLLAKEALCVAYTPMHGVGAPFVKAALERLGLYNLHIEPTQEKPDGDFPTVKFPNPEEEGAMDLVFALAKREKADLVLANDPDADRLAVALPDGKGGYSMLTGDQVGVLLADYMLQESELMGRRRMVATTLVSSQMLGIMAKDLGLEYRTTLTGFKWIANAAIEARQKNDAQFVLGYEEALGYCIGEWVRDKDGVSAVTIFCEMAALAKSQGSTVQARLDRLYRKYGVFLTKQKSLVLPGSDGKKKIQSIMQGLRDTPPKEIGGYKIVENHDLQRGGMDLPPSNVLVYSLEGHRRVIVRPSGTEPKLKCYYEVREAVQDDEKVGLALGRASAQVEILCSKHQATLC